MAPPEPDLAQKRIVTGGLCLPKYKLVEPKAARYREPAGASAVRRFSTPSP